MPFADEAHVAAVLKPHFPALVDLITQAHKDWMGCSFAHTLQDPKVRANVIWNQFLYHAKAKFEGHEQVRFENKGHWQGLLVGGGFFIRMKKGCHQLLSRNYPTKSAKEFNDASVDLFDGVARLELLYTLDDLGVAIDRVAVIQRHRNKVLWAIDLLGGAEDHGQSVINMPIAPRDGGTTAQRVLKPKKTVDKVKKIGNGDAGAS